MEYNYKLISISTSTMKNQWVISDKIVIGLVHNKPAKDMSSLHTNLMKYGFISMSGSKWRSSSLNLYISHVRLNIILGRCLVRCQLIVKIKKKNNENSGYGT